MSEETTLVVYTTSIGYSFELPTIFPHPNVRYVCFCDRPINRKTNWEEVFIDPLFKDDLFRSSREPKILAHRFLDGYEHSLYIDSRVQLKTSPLELWRYLIPNRSVFFGGFYHTKRGTLLDEFEAVLKQRLDFASTIKAQFDSYKENYQDILKVKPVWGGVIARRHNEKRCQNAMHIWYSHILKYARRDQLSLPVALMSLDSEHVHLASDSIHLSEFHEWPVGSAGKPAYYRVNA